VDAIVLALSEVTMMGRRFSLSTTRSGCAIGLAMGAAFPFAIGCATGNSPGAEDASPSNVGSGDAAAPADGPGPAPDRNVGLSIDAGAAGDADSSTGNAVCAPATGTGQLPFAVDSKFVASGFMGDAPAVDAGPAAVVMVPAAPGDDTTCGGNRSSATALGNCHIVTYTPLPKGTGNGWAGVFWQYPANNWGTMGGYAIPAGASKISFWARGQVGAEPVSFSVGYTGRATPQDPCTDSVVNTTPVLMLTNAWQHFSIDISNQPYAAGVLGAFAWSIANPVVPDGGGVTAPIKFYVDDIQWQP
jgi:hypothetical protein